MTDRSHTDCASAAPAPRSRGRPKTGSDTDKRRKIVDVACKLFLDHGYKGVTMAKVAAMAHVSLSTVYRLFSNKLQIFAAIVGKHRQVMVALPGDYDDLPLAQALEHIFRVDLDEATERWRTELVMRVMAEAQQFPELRQVFLGDGPDESRRLLADWLAAQHAAGRVNVPDVAVASRMMMDVAFGMSIRKVNGEPERLSGHERASYLKCCFEMLADGLARREITDVQE